MGTARIAIIVATATTGAALGLPTVPASGAAPLPDAIATIGLGHRAGKLSPRLRVLAADPSYLTAHAAALSLPASGPGSLVREPGGRVLVEIRTSGAASAATAGLRRLGARILNVDGALSTVTAAVAPAALAAIASDAGVAYVNEVLAPMTARLGSSTASRTFVPATGCTPTIPEGDTAMNVATARAANSLDGTGETIGILSDSYNTDHFAVTHALADIATGDLPGTGNPCGRTTPVVVQSDYSGGGQTDEGRAMAELAHALAPGANLAFATSANGELDFASQINTLRTTNHADVIVDDAAYLDEPFFQDGPVATAANAASAAGVPYFSAAGNANVIVDGQNVSSYETPAYRNTSCPSSVSAIEPLLGCHDFDPTAGVDNGDSISLTPGGRFAVDLQWSQPWGAVTNDYDVFLLNAAGTVIAGSAFDQSSFPEPFEFFGYTNRTGATETVRIVIAKFSGGADSRMKFVLLGASGITGVHYNVSSGGDVVGPTIFGHNGASTVGSTAAIPYDNASTSEDYSSRGPVTHYWQPTPGTTALGSPEVIAKPDFAATDDVKSVFLGDVVGGVRRFAGTSAAVAQAAAIGALLQEQDPALTPAQLMSTLSGTARAVTTNGTPTDVGGGYLDAAAALASVVPLPGAPTAVTAINGDTQSTVEWSAARSNPNFPVTDYVVTPTKDGVAQAPIDVGGTSTSLPVTGLTNGSNYSFTVHGVNANGPGPESTPSSAIDLDIPGPPSDVSWIPGDGQADVSWSPPPASGITITGYEVTPFVNGVAQTPQDFADTATTHTLTGLTNGMPYTFKVAATSATGTGPQSGASHVWTVGAPVAPPMPTPSYDGSAVTLTWSAPATDNGSPLTGYGVIGVVPGRTPDTGEFFEHDYGAGTTSAIMSGLSNGEPYAFVVVAVNARGVSPYSPTSAGVTPGLPLAPAAPTPTVSGNASATLTWDAPATGPAPSGYTLRAYHAGAAVSSASLGTPATSGKIGGLTNGLKYRFTVTAADQYGTGPESAQSVAFEAGLPTAPDAIGATPLNNRATVRWHAASGNGSALTHYVVTPYIGTTALAARTYPASATTEIVDGLTNGRDYTFRVAAENTYGTGPKSPTSVVVRVGAPRAPTGVGATTPESFSARVHWTAPPNDGSPITGYVVTPYIDGQAQPKHTYHSTATTENVGDLSFGVTYTFKVAAFNARGTGPQSTGSNHVEVH